MKIEINIVEDGTDEDGEPILTDIEGRIAEAVAEKCANRHRDIIERETIKYVQEKSGPVIELALAEAMGKGVVITDGYGREKSRETLASTVLAYVEKYLGEIVDNRGNTAAHSGDKSRAAYLLWKQVQEVVGEKLDEMVKSQGKILSDVMNQVIADKAVRLNDLSGGAKG